MTAVTLNVCLISPLPPPAGGIARWTQLVTEHLAHSPEARVSVIDTALRLRSPQSTSMVRRVSAGTLEAAWTLLRFARTVIRARPDVVHVNVSGQFGLLRDLAIVRFAGLLGIPTVVHLRFGRVPELARRRTFEWKLLTRLFKAADRVIAIDSRTADALTSACPGVTVDLIPNCVAIEPPTSEIAERRSSKGVLFVGWVLPSKGIEELLQAWATVRRPAWTLRLVGGYDDDYLSDLRSRLPFTEDIEVLGELEHPAVLDEFRTCAVFVLPSHTEGFPNVVVEAMATGAPVIATDVGAIPDMLEGGCGITVPARDATALVDALESVLSDTDFADRLGKAAKTRAESLFAVQPVVTRYIAAWRAAVGRT